jgi:pimeloyl-ACP methyl ester carboxylesterase
MFSKPSRFLFLNIVMSTVYSQQPNTLHDTSPHTIQFVTVEKNVQLEVLDWGGQGKPLILLAGGGNTAHVFDDFAPGLAANFHVYGITRRGFGASQFSAIDNVDRLGKDILAVIDSLGIIKPVLAGHSIAGAELSSVARTSPDRISALIYLEAGYPYAFYNGESPTMKSFMEISGPKQPTPAEKDLTSFKALQNWNAKTYGFQIPESEFRQTWDSTLDGRPMHTRNFPGFAMFSTILNDTSKHDNIPVTSLVIFAIPHMKEAWMTKSPDQKIRTDAQIYFTKIDSLATKQAKAFEDGVPAAQIMKLKGMHYIYISNEKKILKAIRKFISKKIRHGSF